MIIDTDELMRMAERLNDASSHIRQAVEALHAAAAPPGISSAPQVREREQLLLAELTSTPSALDRTNKGGRPPKAKAAAAIIEPAPTATTSHQPPPRSKLLGKALSAEHRQAIAAGRQRAAAAKRAKEAAHVPIVPAPPAARHESRPRFAGIDAQPINVMRVVRKDED